MFETILCALHICYLLIISINLYHLYHLCMFRQSIELCLYFVNFDQCHIVFFELILQLINIYHYIVIDWICRLLLPSITCLSIGWIRCGICYWIICFVSSLSYIFIIDHFVFFESFILFYILIFCIYYRLFVWLIYCL